MFQLHLKRYLIIGVVVLLVAGACKPLSNVGLPATDNPSVEVPSVPEDDFPRPSNPMTIHAVLDTEHSVSSTIWGIGGLLSDETADGIDFTFMTSGEFFTQNDNGNLVPATGSVLTITPISAIDDIPFSQGYLAAFQITPEGLMMENPASLSMTIPGEYDPSQLIGFAADGSGADFHFFPISASLLDGKTYVHFKLMHFSLYGVAQVTQQEIDAQKAYPPSSPFSQDEDELAPLQTNLLASNDELTPLLGKVQLQLGKSYNRLVKTSLDNLSDVACNRVDVVAYQFNSWLAKVDSAGQTEHFQQQINQDATTLLRRLTECAKVTCESCLGNTPGNTLDKAAADTLNVLAAFAGDMATVLDDMDQVSFWTKLTIKCSAEAGLPSPYGESTLGHGQSGPDESAPLVCK